MRKNAKRLVPRAPLTTDRRTGGAHRVRRELSAREDLTMRLNELAQEDFEDADDFSQQLEAIVSDFNLTDEEDEDDYFDYLLDKLETEGFRRMH